MLAATIQHATERPDWHLWLAILAGLVLLYLSAAWLADVRDAEKASRNLTNTSTEIVRPP